MFEWVLGWRTEAGLKAQKGSCTHKALELLAQRKLAEQRGEATFHNDELDRTFVTAEMVPNLALDLGYDHYSHPSRTTWTWAEKDRKDCRKWMWAVHDFNGGMFWPLNRNVVAPEQYFDYEIREPWAKYDYRLPGGQRLNGYLSLKGTVDLVTRLCPGTIEYIDWKTGQRKNWKTGKKKTYADLKDDPQLRIYHHALSRLYPGENIIITIFFIADGGPETLEYSPADLGRTEDIIRKRFEAIRNNVRPKLITNKLDRSWKCEKLCDFQKTKWEGTDKTVCRHMADEVIQLGMDKVTAKYADLTKLNSYGSGGGRSAKDE